MDGTAEDQRRAHLRVGAAAIASFVVLLLLLIASHGRAQADPSVPSIAPAATAQPQQSIPTDPDPDPGFRRHRGFGGREHGGGPGFGGGGVPGGGTPGGGEVAPDPGAGGTTT